MPTPWLILLALVLAACRSSVSAAPPPAGGAAGLRREVWVDGRTLESGDGSRARPWRSLQEALAGPGPVTVHVAAGLYPGPFVLPEGLRLEGAGASTVLHADGEVVARAGGDVELVGLVLQGGGWGLEGQGTLRLEAVAFSGQRAGAVRLARGRLVARATRFEASVSEAVGISLQGPAEAEVRDSTFSGPYRNGLHLQGGAEAVLEGVRFEGPVTALRQQGGRSHLRRVSVEGGRGPGVWVVEGGAVRLEEVAVTGHEFGLAANGAQVEVAGFTSVRAERSGLAVVSSRGTLEDVVVRDSGVFGALQLVDSELTLRRFRVDGADAYGVQVMNGRVKLREGTLTRLRSSEGVSGDGLHLRGGVVDVEGLVVRDAVGVGVLAAQGAEVTLRDVSLSGCREAGVLVERYGAVTARGIEVSGSGGPALVALRDGVLRVDALTARGNREGLLWAECEGETRVLLGRHTGQDAGGLGAPCVGRWTPSETSSAPGR